MDMIRLLYTYLITLPVMFLIDMVWIGFVAKDFYRKGLAEYISTSFVWSAAIPLYFFLAFGVLVFAVYPGIQAGSLQKTLLLAALFGFMCYMTYDLTNLATIRNWPASLTFVDMVWGTTLSTVTAYIMYVVYGFLK